MDAAAFLTYIKKISEFNLVSFMAYTYNMTTDSAENDQNLWHPHFLVHF